MSEKTICFSLINYGLYTLKKQGKEANMSSLFADITILLKFMTNMSS